MMSEEMLNLNLLTIYKKYRDEFVSWSKQAVSMQSKSDLEKKIRILDGFKTDLAKHANHIACGKPALKHEILTLIESMDSAAVYLPVIENIVSVLEEAVSPYIEAETDIDTTHLTL